MFETSRCGRMFIRMSSAILVSTWQFIWLMLLATVRRRLSGKQPPPPVYADVIGPVVDALGLADAGPSAIEAVEDGLAPADEMELPANAEASLEHTEWDYVDRRSLTKLVKDLLQKKETEDDIKTSTVESVFKELVDGSGGRLDLDNLKNNHRNAVIEILMDQVPRELNNRLLAHFGAAARAGKRKRAAEGEDEVLPREVTSQNVQKAYLVTLSARRNGGSGDSCDPAQLQHEAVKNMMLESFATSMTRTERGCQCELEQMAIFEEFHKSGKKHFHVCVQLSDRARFLPWKKSLEERGLQAHFAQMNVAGHSEHRQMQYPNMLKYCYLPSRQKRFEDLDRRPLLYARKGSHPPLQDAINGVLSSEAVAERFEERFLRRCEKGKKGPQRMTDLELWPVVKTLGVTGEERSLLPRMLAHAKQTQNERLLQYILKHSNVLSEKVSVLWQLEHAEELVADATMTPWQRLRRAMQTSQCHCQRAWVFAARELMRTNDLDERSFCQALQAPLLEGLRKGNILCLAGHTGNEGKSWLLRPLESIFKTFRAFGKSSCPLLALPSAHVVVLDDFRMDPTVLPITTTLTWLEGSRITIARPLNIYGSHVDYTPLQPTYMTTSYASLHTPRGKISETELCMLRTRLKIFEFQQQIRRVRHIPPCVNCFCHWMLSAGRDVQRFIQDGFPSVNALQ